MSGRVHSRQEIVATRVHRTGDKLVTWPTRLAVGLLCATVINETVLAFFSRTSDMAAMTFTGLRFGLLPIVAVLALVGGALQLWRRAGDRSALGVVLVGIVYLVALYLWPLPWILP